MVAFLLLLAVGEELGLGPWEYPVRAAVLSAIVVFVARPAIDLRAPHWLGSILLGTGVFLVWVAPDMLWPAYRESWLFQNAMMGTVESSVPAEYRGMPMVVWSRAIRAILIVPIVEELFWRGWLMRWLINPNFLAVPLGTFVPFAFVATALLFASEHGPYWDVGLLAGLAYNWWMIRTRNLGDCVLAHAVTNGLLSTHVVLNEQWQYW